MFIVFLRFSTHRGEAGRLMSGHKAWLQQGFDDGVFLLAGSLQPQAGGVIVAHATSLAELQARVDEDPFVSEDVVCAEIVEVAPSVTDERLSFLLGTVSKVPLQASR